MLAVADGRAAIDRASTSRFDIVLLDVALGGGPDGYEVCRTLRERRNVVPIIMLTALDSEADAVLGLEAGADDYVTKPFGPAELRSRIRAVLRRAGPRALGEEMLRVGPLVLDRSSRSVTADGRPVELTFSEFEVLQAMMSRPGVLFNRQELLRAIWGDSAYRDPRGIDVHIRHLREKLERGAGAARAPAHGPRRRLPAALAVNELRGLRGRFAAALVAVSVLTLAVTALLVLVPLDRKLEQDAVTSLDETTRAARSTFEDLSRAQLRAGSPQLDRAARDLRRQTGADVFVFDASGRMLAGTDIDPRDRFPEATQALKEDRVVSRLGRDEGVKDARSATPFSGRRRARRTGAAALARGARRRRRRGPALARGRRVRRARGGAHRGHRARHPARAAADRAAHDRARDGRARA